MEDGLILNFDVDVYCWIQFTQRIKGCQFSDKIR